MPSSKLIAPLALAGAGLCVAALLVAYFFMQRYLLLEPCPLCILDRIAVAFMAAGFAGVWLARRRRAPRMAWAAWWTTTAALAAGFVFAARHIWLQNRPPDFAGTCLSDHAAAQGLVELVQRAFDAKADCGAIMWEFAGLTIPEQVLLLFAALALLQAALAALLWRERKEESRA